MKALGSAITCRRDGLSGRMELGVDEGLEREGEGEDHVSEKGGLFGRGEKG